MNYLETGVTCRLSVLRMQGNGAIMKAESSSMIFISHSFGGRSDE